LETKIYNGWIKRYLITVLTKRFTFTTKSLIRIPKKQEANVGNNPKLETKKEPLSPDKDIAR